MSSTLKKLAKFVVPALIILFAIGGAAALAKLKPKAQRGGADETAPVVQTQTVTTETLPAQLRATGVVEAARRVTLSPEVSGRVTTLNDKVVPGGRLKKGETVLRVDARDYKTALQQAQAQVEQAKLAVSQEESRKQVAAKEWKLLGDQRPEAEAALALRLPQLANARAQLAGTQAALERAELNISRTAVRAPFAGIVSSKNVEVGQVVSPGAQLLTLVGTDRVWVRGSIPLENLTTLQFADSSSSPTIAEVVLEMGAQQSLRWQATALRVAAEIDTDTRTAQVIFAVDNPMDANEIPLLPGTFVRLEIAGNPIENVVKIPRTGLVNGNEAWVVEDGRLKKRDVSIAWRGDKEVAVKEGLAAGDVVVVTPLSLPIEGMRVNAQASTGGTK